jgi:hypothetical protein
MDLRQRKEIVVSIEEILHTCSNEKVAQAAVSSLGFDFAARVRSAAEGRGVATGVLVAGIIRDFGKTADADDRHLVTRAMEKTDQPILVGLRVILDAYLRANRAAADREWPIGAMLRARPEYGAAHAG